MIHDSILCLEDQTLNIKQRLIDRTIEIFPLLKEVTDLNNLFKISLVSIEDNDLMENKNLRLLAEYLKKKNQILISAK